MSVSATGSGCVSLSVSLGVTGSDNVSASVSVRDQC